MKCTHIFANDENMLNKSLNTKHYLCNNSIFLNLSRIHNQYDKISYFKRYIPPKNGVIKICFKFDRRIINYGNFNKILLLKYSYRNL